MTEDAMSPLSAEAYTPHISEAETKQGSQSEFGTNRAIENGQLRKTLIKEDGTEAHTALAKLHVLHDFLKGEDKEEPQFSLLDKDGIQEAIDVLRNLRSIVHDIPQFLARQSSDFHRQKEQALLEEIRNISAAQLGQIEIQLAKLTLLLNEARKFDQTLSEIDLMAVRAQNQSESLAEDPMLVEMRGEEQRRNRLREIAEAQIVNHIPLKLKLGLAALAVILASSVARGEEPEPPEETVAQNLERVSEQCTDMLQELNVSVATFLNSISNSTERRLAELGLSTPMTFDVSQKTSSETDSRSESLALQEQENPSDILGVDSVSINAETSPFLFNLLQAEFDRNNAEFSQLNIQYEITGAQVNFFIGDQGPLTYSDLQLSPGSDIEVALLRSTTATMAAQYGDADQNIGRQQIELVAQRGNNEFNAAMGIRVLNAFNFFTGSDLTFEPETFIVVREQGVNYKTPENGSTVELLPVTQNLLDILSQYSELDGRELPQIGENIVAEIVELPDEQGQPIRAALRILGNAEIIDINSGYRVVPRDHITGPINIRSGPGTQFDIIGVLSNESVGQLTPMPTSLPTSAPPESGDSWTTVDLNGQIGYISGDLTKIEGLPQGSLPKASVIEASAGGAADVDNLASVSAEILASAPTSILTVNEAEEVVSLPVAGIEIRDGRTVLVDAEGNELAEHFEDLEIGNNWAMLEASSDNLFPIDVYMSTQLNSDQLLHDLERALDESGHGVGLGPFRQGIRVSTGVDVRFHDPADADLADGRIGGIVDNFRADVYLHPVYEGRIVESGSELLEGAVIHIGSIAENEEYSVIRDRLSNNQEIIIPLPNGENWDPNNGLIPIIKRTFSIRQLGRMVSERTFTMNPPAEMYLNENGSLVIEIAVFDTSAANVNARLLEALSQITKSLGAEVNSIEGEDYSKDPQLTAILYSPNQEGRFAWVLDVGRQTPQGIDYMSMSYPQAN